MLELALNEPELSPRELAVSFVDQRLYFVSEASVYRLLKAHDLITSPAFILMKAAAERFRRLMHWIESCAKRGIRVYGQSATLEVGFLFTFKDWNLWDDMPEWREVTTGLLEDRLMKLSDPERRPGLRKVDEMSGIVTNNVRDIFVLECKEPALKKYENQTIGEIATRERKHPVDAMLDIACADGLNTEFYTPPINVRNDYLKEMVTSLGMAIVGVSDDNELPGRAARSRVAAVIHLRRLAPLMPATSISRATRLRPTWTPAFMTLQSMIQKRLK